MNLVYMSDHTQIWEKIVGGGQKRLNVRAWLQYLCNMQEGEMDKIAVLIPCYNEASTIKKVIRDYKQALPEAVIYVYDNNSDDGTDEIAKAEQVIVRYE